jgi:hypothetical protein
MIGLAEFFLKKYLSKKILDKGKPFYQARCMGWGECPIRSKISAEL